MIGTRDSRVITLLRQTRRPFLLRPSLLRDMRFRDRIRVFTRTRTRFVILVIISLVKRSFHLKAGCIVESFLCRSRFRKEDILACKTRQAIEYAAAGVDLVGVFRGSAETTFSGSLSDVGDGTNGDLGAWLLPGKKRGCAGPFLPCEAIFMPGRMGIGVSFQMSADQDTSVN